VTACFKMATEVKFEDTVTYRLARVTTHIAMPWSATWQASGCTADSVVLIELWRQDGVRQIDIADRLNLSAPTINKILKGLAEINLITSSREQGDARSTRVFLTDKGRKIRSQVSAHGSSSKRVPVGADGYGALILPDLLGKLHAAYTGQTTKMNDRRS